MEWAETRSLSTRWVDFPFPRGRGRGLILRQFRWESICHPRLCMLSFSIISTTGYPPSFRTSIRLNPFFLTYAVSYRRYIQMISLSLFFFNLLPITILDGGHLLEILLESSIPSFLQHGRSTTTTRSLWTSRGEEENVELEELESGTLDRVRLETSNGSYGSYGLGRRSPGWGRKGLVRLVNYCVLAMCGVSMIDAFVRT